MTGTMDARPSLEAVWDGMEQIEGYDGATGATSAIDRDQAIDQDTGEARYARYRVTLRGRAYTYTAGEMESFARTW